jgi:hypothetical protein
LLKDYPISSSTKLDPFVAAVILSQPVSVNQWLGLQRFDYSAPEHGQHISIRLASSSLSRPDFIWSPYKDYVSGMQQPVYNASANWTSAVRPTITNQFTSGWSYERLSWARANSEVPTLAVIGGNPGAIPLLPGSPAAYSMNNGGRYLQSYDNHSRPSHSKDWRWRPLAADGRLSWIWARRRIFLLQYRTLRV